jgi:hypothetical protein
MSLVLALVPYVLAAQFAFSELGYLPGWLNQIPSDIMRLQMLVMLVAPLISIICGIVARAQTGKDPSLRGRWKAIAGVYLAVMFLLAAMLTPQISHCDAKCKSANCISNLKSMSTAITLYADDHGDQMPATLEELVNGTYLPVGSTAIQCPESRKP